MNHPDRRPGLRLVTDPPAREDRHLIDETELQRRLTDAFERGAKYGYERGLRTSAAGSPGRSSRPSARSTGSESHTHVAYADLTQI